MNEISKNMKSLNSLEVTANTITGVPHGVSLSVYMYIYTLVNYLCW